VSQQLDENRVIRERLAEAFPGNYGLFLSFHFGRFLNEKIDSPEKETAYGNILEYLDSLADIPFPKELEDIIMKYAGAWNEETMQSLDNGTRAAIDEYENFMKTKRDIIEMYLDYCKSDEYKASPAFQLKKLMTKFQKESGYVDIFIKNMKVLSRGYAEYYGKLQDSNAVFLQEYPEAADILGSY